MLFAGKNNLRAFEASRDKGATQIHVTFAFSFTILFAMVSSLLKYDTLYWF